MHTKGKWEVFNQVDIFRENDTPGMYYIASCAPQGFKDNNPHSRIECEEMKANAEFICKAVNLHDELVEALEDVLSGIDSDAVRCSGEWQTGMFCGLEDKNITDRYQACEHGYNVALDRVAEWATCHIEAVLAKAKDI